MDIKKVFSRYGLTAAQVAERMGTSPTNLSMAINGNPTYQKLCDIAKAVGCTPSELIADEEDNRATKVICPKCGKEIIVKVE
jgi:transcriptional regulator with XRE-family HTH domain